MYIYIHIDSNKRQIVRVYCVRDKSQQRWMKCYAKPLRPLTTQTIIHQQQTAALIVTFIQHFCVQQIISFCYTYMVIQRNYTYVPI